MNTKGQRPARRPRDDGTATRAQLLEAAGIVFAEKGFDRATAKEITQKAGTNAASVNYHFGGVEGLYGQVLAEAHRRLISYQALASGIAAQDDPEAKLRALIATLIAALSGPASSSWALRVLSREFLAPTPHIAAVREQELEPKKALIFAIVAELIDRPPDDPVVARAAFTILAPCVMMLLGDRRIAELFPDLRLDRENIPAIVDQMTRYALAGLAGLTKR